MTLDANSPELRAVEKLRSQGKRIVFTNGCFDILHVGHLRYLTAARQLGDALIIGLNSNESVRRLKGAPRPFVDETERRELLLGLRPVDVVVVFEQDTPLALITEVQPDVLVKGGDWPIDSIVGADVVRARGGTVLSLPFADGFSTSSLVDRIQKKQGGAQ